MPNLEALANGYRAGAIVLNANRLGLFDAIDRDAVTADQLAERLDADPRATRILADALAALEVLEKHGDTYRNSPDVLETLVADAPRPQHAILRHGARLYFRWGFLHDVVKSGEPCRVPYPDGLESDAREFALAMADAGRQGAIETARLLELDTCRTMLDAGGGPGLYAVACAQANPTLEVTLLDGHDTLDVARETIEASGCGDRIHTRPGDLLADDPGAGYDLILLSNVIHQYSEEQNAAIVRRLADALAPGGRICIKDFVLDDSRISPVPAAIFAINMLVNTERGDCYTAAQIHGWYRQAGLEAGAVKPVATTSRLVFGSKPA